MSSSYVKIFTESTIIVKRLQSLLQEHNIESRVKSDRLAGYEITNYIDELFVFKEDMEKVKPILEEYKAEISS